MLQGLLKRCDLIAQESEKIRAELAADDESKSPLADLAAHIGALAAIVGELINRELGTPVNPQTGKPL